MPVRHGQNYEEDVALSRALEQSALDSSYVASNRSAGLEAKGQVRHISLGGMLLVLKPNRFLPAVLCYYLKCPLSIR